MSPTFGEMVVPTLPLLQEIEMIIIVWSALHKYPLLEYKKVEFQIGAKGEVFNSVGQYSDTRLGRPTVSRIGNKDCNLQEGR